jgi:exonuclease SbcC
MRLVEVEIENYKQYAGTHLFRPGEKAMVAVVGQNGAGKTTLFEAIEWCLYNPSRIKNDTLTPRVKGGKPRVRVVIEDPHSGIVYEIERLLKGGSTQAEIYRQDQPDSPIVQGTRQVTEYVTKELTGLSHTAFVATFFTRQKELSFFGDLGATQRREQVGRLLGLETIRVAQKRIGEQRTRKHAEARVKRDQYEEQSSGIDFPAERERLDRVITDQTTQRDNARAQESARKQETAVASAGRDLAQQRFAIHADLLQSLERINGDANRFEEMRATAQRDLVEIADAELEIARQQEHAANEPELRALLERHEAEKKKSETADRLRSELERLLTDRQAIESVVSVAGLVGASGTTGTMQSAAVLIEVFDTEIARLAAIDLEALRLRRDASRHLVELDQQRSKARSRLEQMEQLAADLTRQVEELASDGLPADRLKATQRERAVLQQGASAAYSVAAQTELRANQLRSLEQSLRASEFGELCPTCARPFQPGEAAQTLNALAEQVSLLERDIAAERATAEQMTQQAAALAAVETRLTGDVERYQNLTGRLETGSGMIEAQEREVATIDRELEVGLRESQRQAIPEQQEIDRLDQEVKQAEADCDRRPRLEMGRERLVSSIEQQASLEEQIGSLGPIAYDLNAHNRDYAAWSIARDAVARIDELRKQVARRPEREATVEHAASSLTALTADRARVEGDVRQLGFDVVEVENANRIFTLALDQERAATEAAHAAEQQLTRAQRERDDLDKLEAQLRALADESAAAEIAASELDRIYREFARFEKYVAVAVTPVLGEIASELLEKATDGRYDRLEFTEDYGIEVYDGEDDRFPLSQYSGGERDVIALCARLALSQIIGGQAATPIKFMVLDEVFGSLDLDRRRNLMEMLQRLMEENQAFQQLFVISHVDDVRAGSMFDEVWKVSETGDGVSQLEQVSVTGSLEDY